MGEMLVPKHECASSGRHVAHTNDLQQGRAHEANLHESVIFSSSSPQSLILKGFHQVFGAAPRDQLVRVQAEKEATLLRRPLFWRNIGGLRLCEQHRRHRVHDACSGREGAQSVELPCLLGKLPLQLQGALLDTRWTRWSCIWQRRRQHHALNSNLFGESPPESTKFHTSSSALTVAVVL